MAKSTGSLAAYPARTSLIWYLGLIVTGTVLLSQPWARDSELPITLVEALFTSTSAACVTGLSVRSTGNDFSLAGQAIILGLIQVGGIGIMTLTTYITFQLGGRAGLRERAVIAETLGGGAERDLRWVLRNVIVLSLGTELVGFAVLAMRMRQDFDTLFETLWSAAFHAISAFNNAGFSLFDDSLVRYQGDPVVNLTVIAMIVIGGIGFPVLLDLRRNWRRTWIGLWEHLTLHSKIMLIGTAGLTIASTAIFLALEWDGALREMPWPQKLLISLFQVVTCRTAGFNTVEIGALTNATLFIMMLLMMIGGGPCSTAGGFKVSTFMSLVLQAWATSRGYHRVNIFRRTLEPRNVERATTTALIFSIVAVLALTALLVVEQSGVAHYDSEGLFLDAAFEIVSALATVGLSTGITTLLSPPAQLILVLLMFAGRLGPISVFAALSRSERRQRIEYPYEELLIG